MKMTHSSSTRKSTRILAFALVAALAVGLGFQPAFAGEKKKNEAELLAKAKVSKEDAQKTALAKVPNGTIKEGELEKEKGKIIWSFDISTPNTTDITEVNVDAVTGEVVSVDVEKAADEAKEAKEEKGKGKHEKD